MCLFHCLSFLGCKTLKTYEREKNNWKEKKKKKFYVTKKVHKLKSYELYHQFENDIIFFFILLSCHAANSSFMIAVSVCTTITICDLMVEIDILLACIFLSKINFFLIIFLCSFVCDGFRWDEMGEYSIRIIDFFSFVHLHAYVHAYQYPNQSLPILLQNYDDKMNPLTFHKLVQSRRGNKQKHYTTIYTCTKYQTMWLQFWRN